MKIRNVFYSILAVALVWSCGKDEAVKAPVNNAPVIADQAFDVAETITETDIIGKVAAVDADKDALTFSITTNDKELFSITKDGALSLATGKTLDFDKATSHKITVKVSDGTKDASAKITINVSEDSEGEEEEEEEEEEATNEAPVFDEENFVFEVSEDIADTDAIGTLTATDSDGDDLTYSLVTDESELFVLSETGELTLAEGKALDYETATEYALEVSVTDGELEATAKVTITVLNVIESMFEDPASFITTWNYDDKVIQFNLEDGSYDYNYTIDWGDGTVEELTGDDLSPSHSYDEPGTYKVAIQGEFPYFTIHGISAPSLVSIDQWGSIAWERFADSFKSCENMVYNATDVPDLSKVTDMAGMFQGATSFNGDLSGWDTSNVEIMGFMFLEADSFDGDISSWDTSNVEYMSYMFYGASSFNRDISGWDTSNVTDMSNMFYNTTAFDQNLDKWDIGKVESMSNMFKNSGMSASNFSNTLIGWAKLEVQSDVKLGAAGIDLCVDGEAAVDTLEDDYNWDITFDDLVDCN